MTLFLVYEFTYYSYDEDISEGIEFYGLCKDKNEAINKANERIKNGIENENVIVSKHIKNRENPFSETDCVDMCRDDEDERTIYSINIKEFKIEGDNKK